MTSQSGTQTNAIHTLPNISRSKDNKTIKFDQLIEYSCKTTQKMWRNYSWTLF